MGVKVWLPHLTARRPWHSSGEISKFRKKSDFTTWYTWFCSNIGLHPEISRPSFIIGVKPLRSCRIPPKTIRIGSPSLRSSLVEEVKKFPPHLTILRARQTAPGRKSPSGSYLAIFETIFGSQDFWDPSDFFLSKLPDILLRWRRFRHQSTPLCPSQIS